LHDEEDLRVGDDLSEVLQVGDADGRVRARDLDTEVTIVGC
jgi:hypothetical protein